MKLKNSCEKATERHSRSDGGVPEGHSSLGSRFPLGPGGKRTVMRSKRSGAFVAAGELPI